MNSTPNPKATEPDDVECADEQLAHVTEQPSKPDHDAARHPSAVPGRRPSRDRRGLIGLLLATCIFVAAFVSQSSYDGAAKLRWAAQLVLTSSEPLKKTGLPVQPSPSAAQVVAAESMPSQLRARARRRAFADDRGHDRNNLVYWVSCAIELSSPAEPRSSSAAVCYGADRLPDPCRFTHQIVTSSA
jgi:hypothetical protein